jgi:hypothetical protein
MDNTRCVFLFLYMVQTYDLQSHLPFLTLYCTVDLSKLTFLNYKHFSNIILRSKLVKAYINHLSVVASYLKPGLSL